MEGAHFLKGFEGENVRKNNEKTATATEHREIKGLTFLVLNFLIFLFSSIVFGLRLQGSLFFDFKFRFYTTFHSYSRILRSKIRNLVSKFSNEVVHVFFAQPVHGL